MEATNKVYIAWKTSNSEERVEFVKILCRLYRPLLKWTLRFLEKEKNKTC